MRKDPGHDELLADLKGLYKEAIEFEFHDSKNENYTFPKLELVERLSKLIEKVKEGKYDNV